MIVELSLDADIVSVIVENEDTMLDEWSDADITGLGSRPASPP